MRDKLTSYLLCGTLSFLTLSSCGSNSIASNPFEPNLSERPTGGGTCPTSSRTVISPIAVFDNEYIKDDIYFGYYDCRLYVGNIPMNEFFSHQGENIAYSKILIETNSQSIIIEDMGHTAAYTTFSLGVPLKYYKEIYDKLSNGQAKLVIYTNPEIRNVGRMMCGSQECGK